MMFEFADDSRRLTDIRVAGIGGAGGNAVDRMIQAGLVGVEFLALNTDLQALADSQAHHTMQIGAQLTQGLGSGGNPDVGEAAAEEDRDAIRQSIEGANMVFVTAGMGGGTGTGAAPVVAEIARKAGALTVGIITKPFRFEGKVRLEQADEGIRRLREVVDTLIVVPNQRLLTLAPPNTSMDEAFLMADQVLYEATRGIYEIISRHDTLNLDFADVCSVMRGMGVALMGTGRATGENRALEAAKAAIQSPLLENLDIKGSKAVLVNVLGGQVGLHDTAEAMDYIQEAAGQDAHVIFGYGVDETLGDTLQVTVVATGFNAEESIGGSVSMASKPVEVIREAESVAEEPEPVVEPAAEPVVEPEALESVPDEVAEAPRAEEMPEAFAPLEDLEPELVSVLDEEEPRHREDTEVSPPLVEEPVAEEEVLEDLVRETVAEAIPEAIPEAPQEQPPFLQRAAAGGSEAEETITTTPPPAPPSDPIGRFLRPVGRRNIGEVEVPATEQGPVPISRSTASGIGPENPDEDRGTPAYIRKYMD